MALPDNSLCGQMSEADYLHYEQDSDLRHELINGQVIAMTGASPSYNRVSVNLIRILGTMLRQSACEVYGSDMRVKIPNGNYVYPDLSIVCGESKFDETAFATLTNPQCVIEILSPTTEAYDRGEKFRQYRRIPTLREYLLVAQDSARIDQYWQQSDAIWRFTDVEGLDANLALKTIDCELLLREVYERVVLSADDT
jgi:Uma2 family endonuclease